MNSMTEIRTEDKRQTIMAQTEQLLALVEQAYEGKQAVHELERSLFQGLLGLGHQLLGQFFALCGTGDAGAKVVLEDGREVKRLETLHGREYLSVFGLFELERTVYGSREGQKIEYVPLDAQWQLPGSKFSYLLQQWDQGLVVEAPYTQVSEWLERLLGFGQSVHSLERINGQLSSSVAAFWEARAPAPPAQGEEIVVCSADGKGVVMRGEPSEVEAAEPGAASEDTTGGGKKMALIGAAYTIAPYVRTPEEVLEALFAAPETSAEKPPLRPKPVAKYVRASFERDAQETMAPSYSCIFSWLDQEQRQRDPDNSHRRVVLMDGQQTLWQAAREHFQNGDSVEILDLMHALKYLWEAAALLCPEADQATRRAWVKQQTKRILNGGVETVIRSLRALGAQHAFNAEQRKKLQKICGYLSNNASRMRYDQYLQAGYPIASGVIEGACRHVVCDRMERSGMRWVRAGAQAMLGLRCIGINREWDPFMAFHIGRENRRLYPLKAANDEAGCQARLAA
jgi:hypothetical protein